MFRWDNTAIGSRLIIFGDFKKVVAGVRGSSLTNCIFGCLGCPKYIFEGEEGVVFLRDKI